jgi:hypothetical protein
MGKALRSQAFANAHLRIDGSGIDAPTTDGGGTVNCQSGVADFEVLREDSARRDRGFGVARIS